MVDQTEIEKQGEGKGPSSAGYWNDRIKSAETAFAKYNEKCDNIDKLYADLESLSKVSADREFQIFWANLEVIKPSIYARPPVPVVVPRFKDRKELPRKASELLERALNTAFELDDIDGTMRHVRDDLAINARGAPWVRYEATEEKEKVCIDHLDRYDFLHDPARKWKEVDWVARGVWLNRKDGIARFGKVFLKAEFKTKDADKSEDVSGEAKARVWEIWCKSQNKVIWVSPGIDDVLDEKEPFLELDGFFPCPRPAFGTLQRRSLIPVPDFVYYRDQVEEINELTARISALSEGLRLKGFYASGNGDVADAIETAIKSNDNNAILIPISNFAQIGGAALKDAIVWLPIEEVATIVAQLVSLRKQLIDDVYQITGISDIMRGTTAASETLGAQQLKSQYGSVRIKDRQNELIRIAKDVAVIAAEIMAENFRPKTLLEMSQVDDLPTQESIDAQIADIEQKVQLAVRSPEAQQLAQENPEKAQQLKKQVLGQIEALKATVTIEKVMILLREQRLRPFVLDIETDSTIEPDENAAKQRATEFITAIGGFLGQAMGLVQQSPESAPMAAEMLKFVASQFRAGRELDGVIDEYAEKVKEAASQPKQPSPEQIKAQTEQQKAQLDAQAMQSDQQIKQQEATVDLQKGQIEMREIMADIQKTIAETEKINAETIAIGQPEQVN